MRLNYSLFDTENAEPFELCVLPLDAELEPHGTFPLFNMTMKLDAPPLYDPKLLTGKEVADAMLKSPTRDQVAFLFQNWFHTLELPKGKKLMPLAYKWPPVREVLVKWLGHETYSEIFDESYRDILVAAHMENDRMAVKGSPVTFAKQELSWIAKELHVQRHTPGNPAEDCMTIGRCYKRLLQL